jgi:hypothetical protein
LVYISNLIKIRHLTTLVVGIVLAAGLVGAVSATERSIGSGPDDWWTVYPDQHPNAGSEVDHPQWILDELEEKPVLILDHSTGKCKACIDQESYVDAVLEDYGDDVTYENLISGGSDTRADELFDIYDPNGGKPYIPLTVILTLVEDSDGNVVVGWHSMEDPAGGEEMVRSYVEDAIDYHEENVGDWDA